MNPGEAPGNDDPQAEVAGRERRVLAARALPVVLARHDGVPAALAHVSGPRGVALVDHVEGELADLGDVAPVGQDARACRQDLVG